MLNLRSALLLASVSLAACGTDSPTPLADVSTDSGADTSDVADAAVDAADTGADTAPDVGTEPDVEEDLPAVTVDPGLLACTFRVVDGCIDCMADACPTEFEEAVGPDRTLAGGACRDFLVCGAECDCNDTECLETCLDETMTNGCLIAVDAFQGCAEPSCEAECSASECGDGRVTGAEMCEPALFTEEIACEDVGFEGDGTVSCQDNCTVDISQCDRGVTQTTGTCEAPIDLIEAGELSEDEGWIRATGTTIGADLVHNGSCSEDVGREVVFVWTATESGQVAIRHFEDGEEGHTDPLLHVRTECGDSETEVACNDDSDLSDTLNSLVFFDAEAGQTYYIFADSYDLEEEGSFTIELSL